MAPQKEKSRYQRNFLNILDPKCHTSLMQNVQMSLPTGNFLSMLGCHEMSVWGCRVEVKNQPQHPQSLTSLLRAPLSLNSWTPEREPPGASLGPTPDPWVSF